eukprot:TRINITY_DN4314_c0_g2_i1.p1 TRINITY_DN4314_c0_g2~~TRINITY_DN4314_c0_g2_i1.p1  ORF type:complete len:996 (+),score=237.47 TRINITY_DN4314_c0_g2_i1:143-3130(+)
MAAPMMAGQYRPAAVSGMPFAASLPHGVPQQRTSSPVPGSFRPGAYPSSGPMTASSASMLSPRGMPSALPQGGAPSAGQASMPFLQAPVAPQGRPQSPSASHPSQPAPPQPAQTAPLPPGSVSTTTQRPASPPPAASQQPPQQQQQQSRQQQPRSQQPQQIQQQQQPQQQLQQQPQQQPQPPQPPAPADDLPLVLPARDYQPANQAPQPPQPAASSRKGGSSSSAQDKEPSGSSRRSPGGFSDATTGLRGCALTLPKYSKRLALSQQGHRYSGEQQAPQPPAALEDVAPPPPQESPRPGNRSYSPQTQSRGSPRRETRRAVDRVAADLYEDAFARQTRLKDMKEHIALSQEAEDHQRHLVFEKGMRQRQKTWKLKDKRTHLQREEEIIKRRIDKKTNGISTAEMREEEELKLCTFQPKLLSRRGKRSNSPFHQMDEDVPISLRLQRFVESQRSAASSLQAMALEESNLRDYLKSVHAELHERIQREETQRVVQLLQDGDGVGSTQRDLIQRVRTMVQNGRDPELAQKQIVEELVSSSQDEVRRRVFEAFAPHRLEAEGDLYTRRLAAVHELEALEVQILALRGGTYMQEAQELGFEFGLADRVRRSLPPMPGPPHVGSSGGFSKSETPTGQSSAFAQWPLASASRGLSRDSSVHSPSPNATPRVMPADKRSASPRSAATPVSPGSHSVSRQSSGQQLSQSGSMLQNVAVVFGGAVAASGPQVPGLGDRSLSQHSMSPGGASPAALSSPPAALSSPHASPASGHVHQQPPLQQQLHGQVQLPPNRIALPPGSLPQQQGQPPALASPTSRLQAAATAATKANQVAGQYFASRRQGAGGIVPNPQLSATVGAHPSPTMGASASTAAFPTAASDGQVPTPNGRPMTMGSPQIRSNASSPQLSAVPPVMQQGAAAGLRQAVPGGVPALPSTPGASATASAISTPRLHGYSPLGTPGGAVAPAGGYMMPGTPQGMMQAAGRPAHPAMGGSMGPIPLISQHR